MIRIMDFLALLNCMLPLAIAAIWIWSVIDVAKYEPEESNNKIIWFLMVLLMPVLGFIIYCAIRRGERKRTLGY